MYNCANDEMKLVIYITVNKYYKTTILALCFIKTESLALYSFAHSSYRDVGFSKPKRVFTDRTPAHMKIFNGESRRRACLCPAHTFRNIPEFLADILKKYGEDFKKEFLPVLKELGEDQFEEKFMNFQT